MDTCPPSIACSSVSASFSRTLVPFKSLTPRHPFYTLHQSRTLIITYKKDMEDSVTEREKMGFPPLNLNPDPYPSSGEKRDGDEEEVGKTNGSGSLINQFISNLVSSPRSRKERDIYVEKVVEEEKKQVELDGTATAAAGGIINNFISNLVSSPKARDVYEEKVDQEEKKQEELDGTTSPSGGGVINNFISDFFHQNEGEAEGEGKKEEKEKTHLGVEKEKPKVEAENGGGIISTIVSNLSAPISEKAVPDTDETAILIHSIIHD